MAISLHTHFDCSRLSTVSESQSSSKESKKNTSFLAKKAGAAPRDLRAFPTDNNSLEGHNARIKTEWQRGKSCSLTEFLVDGDNFVRAVSQVMVT